MCKASGRIQGEIDENGCIMKMINVGSKQMGNGKHKYDGLNGMLIPMLNDSKNKVSFCGK